MAVVLFPILVKKRSKQLSQVSRVSVKVGIVPRPREGALHRKASGVGRTTTRASTKLNRIVWWAATHGTNKPKLRQTWSALAAPIWRRQKNASETTEPTTRVLRFTVPDPACSGFGVQAAKPAYPRRSTETGSVLKRLTSRSSYRSRVRHAHKLSL
jgi:hypothetical protein